MNQKLGITMVFIAAMAWSTAGLFTRVVSTDIPTTLFWRSLIGGLCVLLIYVFLFLGENLLLAHYRLLEWCVSFPHSFTPR